ncbi:MAG: hypothetical protein AAB387_02700, partial [candidate division NC10 bacterium]
MTSPRFRSLGEWALVGGAFAALVAVVAVWLALDQRPPEWDHANHLERVVVAASAVNDLGDPQAAALIPAGILAWADEDIERARFHLTEALRR